MMTELISSHIKLSFYDYVMNKLLFVCVHAYACMCVYSCACASVYVHVCVFVTYVGARGHFADVDSFLSTMLSPGK